MAKKRSKPKVRTHSDKASESIELTDLVPLPELQRLMDSFHFLIGLTPVFIDLHGRILTEPTMCDFCILTRKSEIGKKRCMESDIRLGKEAVKAGKAVISFCDSGHLIDAFAPIIVAGRHVGFLSIGQVLFEPLKDLTPYRKIAREIGTDESRYIEALKKVTIVKEEWFKKTVNCIEQVANTISNLGYQRLKERRTKEEIEHAVALCSNTLDRVARKGDLTARINVKELSGKHKQIGKDINELIESMQSNIERLRKHKEELNQTLSICKDAVDRVAQKGDLNARIDVSELAGEHKTIGIDINLIIDFLQNKIEEIRKHEEELKEINAVNIFTYINIPDAYVVTDKEWRVLEVNKAFERITGYKREKVIGKLTEEFPAEYECGRTALWRDEDELKRMVEIHERTPPGGTIHEIVQWRTKYGELRTIDLIEIYLPEEISKNIGFVIIGKDITEERKREKEVREARAYAEAIIANLADPLWVTDKEGNWILVNEAMENVTGYNKKEVSEKQMLTHPLFRPFISMLDGKEKLKEMIEKVKAGEHIPGIFIPWLTKDNNLLMMSCSGEPLRDAAGNVIGGVFIGKDMSVLQKAGALATKTLTRKVEAEVGKNYELACLLFMSNAAIIVGDSSLEILRGTVDGYNRRFNKNIGIKEGIALTNMPEEEWPPFLEFLLSRFFECIGPTTFECVEGIKSIEKIVERVKAVYGR